MKQKTMDVSSAIVNELLENCECPYSDQYIANSSLLCGTSTQEVIYQSNLLNSGRIQATDLKQVVQDWVGMSPQITVGGVALKVQSYCLVDLETLGDTEECETLNPTTEESQDEDTELIAIEGRVNIAAIAGGLVGGMAFILVLMALMLSIGIWIRKSGSEKKYGEHKLEE